MMIRKLLFTFLSLLVVNLASAQLLTESFETDGEGTRYTSNFFNLTCNDHFLRAQDSDVGVTICPTNVPAGEHGTFYWSGEDTDQALGGEAILTLNPLAVTGFALDMDVYLALGRPNDFRLEPTDYLIFEYNMDGGGWNQFGAFYGSNDGSGSGNLVQDADLNGAYDPGGAEVNSFTFQNFNFTIPALGNSVQIRFRLLASIGSEEVLLDYIRVNGSAACADPTVPTVTASPISICPGANSTLNISGTLNDATQWHIYTGSCGGTQIGTTTTSTFVVSPATTTTYYVRGEGGCVTPGVCGQVTVTVGDAVNPTISCPGNQTGNVDASCNFSLPDYTSLATASDNCTASPTVTQSPAPGTNVGVGTTVITLTAADGNGNTANCNFNVVVSDVTNPTITCPGNQTGNVDASCSFSLPDYTALATANDNCPGVTVTQVPAPGTNVGVGTTNIVLTATDGSSNTANCSFDVVVSDNTNPTAVCQNITVYLDGAGNATITAGDIDGGSTDNCAGLSLSAAPTAFTCADLGANNVTLTATDGNSNADNCVAVVTVMDTISSVITCPGNQIETPDASCQFTLPDYTALATGTDNCGAVLITQSPAPGTNVGVGTTNIVLTATDGYLNTSNCSFDVVVSDNTNPTITCPGNQVGSVDASCNFSLPDYTSLATANDNCPGVTVTQVPAPGTNVGIGTTNIVLTATDGSSNTANCNFDVVVSDNTNPTITCPGDQNQVVDAVCQFTLADYTGLATASDNCPGVTVTQTPVPGTTVTVTGAVAVTLTATDASGNSANCNFNVVGLDGVNPTITCPGNQTGTVDASCNFSLPDYTSLATVNDNCPGVTVTQVPAPGTNVGVGTTNIVLIATDISSNSANCNFDVVVSDATNPTITCPGNQTGNVDASCNFSLPDYTSLATANDNCPGVTVTQVPAPGTNVGVGTTNIVLTATDGSSNTANCNFDVVVTDATNPMITCPGNQTGTVDANCNFSVPDYTSLATASDNCPGVTVTQVPAPGTNVGLGITSIVLTATDAAANTSNCSFDLNVSDNTNPTAVCQNITVYLDGAGNATITAGDIDGGSTDNCAGLSLSAAPTAFTCADLGANNVTLTATDGNSNADNCVAVVTVMDTISSVITCPGNQIETPDASCQFTLPDYTALATGTDNCGAVLITQSPAPGTVVSANTTITMTADDGNGNTSSCTFDVVLNDATAPTAVCQNITVYLDGSGNATITAGDIDGGSSDNCSGLTLSASPTSFTCADIGANNVTLTATDGNSNTDNCVAVVTILDTISPSVTCPGNQTEIASAVCDFVLPDYTGLVTASDNCAASPTVTQSPAAGTTITANTTITMTATDGNGNISSCTFDIVLDVSGCQGTECNNAIVFGPHNVCGDTTVLLGNTVGGTPTGQGTCGTTEGTGGANWYTFTSDGGFWTASTVNAGTSYDTKLWVFEGACPTLNCVTGNNDFVGLQSQVSFLTTPGVTYYVVVGGFSSSEGDYELSVWNQETVAPVPDAAVLLDIFAECDVVSAPAPTATDNCAGVISAVPDVTFPITTQGLTTITWTYDDGNGNTASQTQNVIIDDLTAPVADNNTLADVSAECEVLSVTAPTATDNCVGAVTGTPDVSFPITTLGTTVVTWTYDDGNGNTSTQTQNVIVTDTTAATPDVASLSDEVGCDAVTAAAPTATDACSGNVITGTPDVTFPVTTPGTTVVTWTYDDGNGNISTQTQNVIVNVADVGVTQSGATLTADAAGATYQWVDCDNNFAVIAGETNQSFTPTATTGNYAVIVTENGCTDTSACFLVDYTGISDVTIGTISIYPNPTDGQFNIELNGLPSSDTEIQITDVRGRLVFKTVLEGISESQIVSVDISNEESGVYFIKVLQENGVILSQRIVKE